VCVFLVDDLPVGQPVGLLPPGEEQRNSLYGILFEPLSSGDLLTFWPALCSLMRRESQENVFGLVDQGRRVVISVRSFAPAILSLALGTAGHSVAQPMPPTQGPRLVARMSSGLYDVRRTPTVTAQQVEFVFEHKNRFLQPLVGFIATQTQDNYLYFGVLTDLSLLDPLRVAFRFAGGLFHQGRGIDLGYPLEFRSEIEVTWNLDDHNRFGVGLAHLSNGALSSSNPGLEALLMSYYFVR